MGRTPLSPSGELVAVVHYPFALRHKARQGKRGRLLKAKFWTTGLSEGGRSAGEVVRGRREDKKR